MPCSTPRGVVKDEKSGKVSISGIGKRSITCRLGSPLLAAELGGQARQVPEIPTALPSSGSHYLTVPQFSSALSTIRLNFTSAFSATYSMLKLSRFIFHSFIRCHHEYWLNMSAMALWMSQRGRIAAVLSLCFVCAAYYLWTGQHEILVTSPHLVGAKSKNTNSTDPNIVDIDETSNLDDHFAFHTQIYAPTGVSKSSHVNPEDYDNHFAIHTKTFTPLPAAVKMYATPVQSVFDGRPIATLTTDEFDPSPIREICAQTTWAPSRDVVINCEGRVGGVGMIYSTVHLQTQDIC
jgi:hypothetical protein